MEIGRLFLVLLDLEDALTPFTLSARPREALLGGELERWSASRLQEVASAWGPIILPQIDAQTTIRQECFAPIDLSLINLANHHKSPSFIFGDNNFCQCWASSCLQYFILKSKGLIIMIYSKQLYQTTSFNLPQIGTISLNPFPSHAVEQQPDLERDEQLKKIYMPNQQQFRAHCHAYLSQFEQICAKENLYPFMIKAGATKFAVVCRQFILLCDWHFNQQGNVHQGGDSIIKIDKYQKIKIAQVPSTLYVGSSNLFVGYQTGRISQYLFKTRSWEGISDDLQFPIMQIQIVKQEENKESTIIALDSAGNIATITFSHKTFMDKIIKTLTSLRWVSFQFRNKKRQKIKKIFQNLISKEKQGNETQSSSSQTVGEGNLYLYNKFHLKQLKNDLILTVYRKNRLQLLLLNKQFQVYKTIEVYCAKLQQSRQQIAFVELGEGGFQNSNIRHQILVIGINKSILFFRLLTIQESYEALFISEIECQEKVLFGSFISNSLLVLGTNKSILIQNVNDQPKQIIGYDKSKFSYVDFFIDQQKVEMDQKLFNWHLLAILTQKNNQDKKFLCLQGKRLIAGSFFSWESILHEEIQQQRWERALICYQQIYNSTFRLCCEVNQDIGTRNQQMKSLCKVIVMGYLHNKLPILKSPSKMRNFIINNIIYFLLKCDQSQLLFHEIEAFLTANELQQNFLNELSHYVQQKDSYKLKIPYISQRILNKIIKKYKLLQEQYILERLFMKFDLNQMQKLILLTICLREELYQSLIYICCQQKDYITPIIKLCGIRITNPQKQGRIAQIIYWYLSQCLLGRLTDYGNEADYINMLTILINFMFIPSSLEMLLQTSHQFLIQIINMFFEPRILRHVLQNQQKFFMRKGQEGDPIFQQGCLKQYKLYEKMLSTLIKVIQNSPQAQRQVYELQLNRFLTSIMVKNQFPFLSTIKIKIILFYINHPFIFLQEHQENITQQNEIYMNGHLMRLLDSLVRSISQKCLYIREKIKDDSFATEEIEQLMVRTKSTELSKILQAILISQYNMQFSQTKCYIHHELGNYAEVMETYLRMTNKKIRIKIYQYLDNNIREYEKLTCEFSKYMISLLNIDQKKTSCIIENLREQWVNQEEIIDKLVQFPNIQLSYIQKVIHNGNQKSKKLLLRHLEIVLREKSEEIQYFINKIDYPLEQAFRMCEQSNNKKGKAFILIKSGRNMEGVLIIAQIFLESIQQYLRGLFKKIQYDQQKKVRIMGQFRVVLNTCYKQWSIDNDRGQQIWQKITQIIFKKLNVNNIDSPHIPESIRSILNEIVFELLSTMLEQVSTDFFLNRFVKTFSALPLRIFIMAYKFIYHRLEFTFTLQKLNKDLLQSKEVAIWKQIMLSIFHGHVCNLICNLCNHPITNHERMVSYNCAHIFHQQCYYQQNNKKNKNQLCPLCFNSIDSYMICNDQKLPRYRLQIDEQQLLRHKINKMNYYDRTTLMANMENWSKYEQWVDI